MKKYYLRNVYPAEYFNPHVQLEYNIENDLHLDCNEAEIKALQYDEYKNKYEEIKKLKNDNYKEIFDKNALLYQEELRMKNREEMSKRKEDAEKILKKQNFNKTVFNNNMKQLSHRNFRKANTLDKDRNTKNKCNEFKEIKVINHDNQDINTYHAEEDFNSIKKLFVPKRTFLKDDKMSNQFLVVDNGNDDGFNRFFDELNLNQNNEFDERMKSKNTLNNNIVDLRGDIEEELLKEDMFQPTNLPLLVINSENGEMPQGRDKETKVNANFLIINEGKVHIKKTGTIKLRGNSSLNSEKKPYLINFDEKTEVLDMPAKAKKWTLIPNMYDKTLMRNILGYKMASIFDLKFSPSCRYIDLILNGDYRGNYLICDKIEVAKDRVNITKMDETCIKEPEISGGYLVQGTGSSMSGDISTFKTDKGITLSYEYPKAEDITEDQKSYLKSKLDEIEAKVYVNITENIDLESFARYFLVEDFSANQDGIFNSFYLYKERGDDKIYFGPVWDFDLAFDNALILYPTNEKKNFAYKFALSNGSANKFLSNLLSNDTVLQKVKDTWKLMTNTVFTKEVMRNYINEQFSLIYESQRLNYIRWDVLNARQFMEAVIRGSFEAEVDYLKEYVEERFDVFGEIVANATSASILEEYPRPGPWGDQWGKHHWKKNENNLRGNDDNN